MPVSLDAKLAAPSSSASKPTPPKLQCKELGGFGPPEAQAGELGDIYFDTTVGSCAMYGKIAGESGPYWKKWPGPDPQHLPIPHPKFPRHYLWALVPVGHAMGWIEAARAIPIVATEFDTSVLIARKLADRRKSRDRYSETKRKRNDGDGASSEPLSQKRKHSDDDDDAMAPEVPDEAQKQVVLRRTKIFKPYSNEPGRPQIQERYTEFQGIGAPDGKHADIGDIYVDLTEGSNALYGKLQSGWVKWPGSDDPAHPLIEHPKFPNIYLWVGKGNFAMGWVPCSRVKYRSDVSASSAIEMKLKYREKTLGYVSKHTKKDKADSPPFHGRTISTTAVDKSSMAHQNEPTESTDELSTLYPVMLPTSEENEVPEILEVGAPPHETIVATSHEPVVASSHEVILTKIHLQLMFEKLCKEYQCRICRELSKMPNGQPGGKFGGETSLDVLRSHSLTGHSDECKRLLSLGEEQIQRTYSHLREVAEWRATEMG